MKTGDAITITADGRTVAGTVLLASENGVSLVIGFEAILYGHVGMMPVLRDEDGVYRSLLGSHEIKIAKGIHPTLTRGTLQ